MDLWNFVSKIVLTYCKKKIVLEKLLKFEVKGREFAKKFRSLEQFVKTMIDQYNFETECFF